MSVLHKHCRLMIFSLSIVEPNPVNSMFLFLNIFITFYEVIFNFSVPCIPTFFHFVHFSGRYVKLGPPLFPLKKNGALKYKAEDMT